MPARLKRIPIIPVIMIIFLAVIAIPAQAAQAADSSYRELPAQYNVSPQKANWTIKFTLPIDEKSLAEENIYIINQDNQSRHSLKYELSADKKTIYIIPRTPYEYNSTYCLYIEEGIRSNTESAVYLCKKSKMKFTTIQDPNAPQITLNIDNQTIIRGNTAPHTYLLQGTIDKTASVTVNGVEATVSSLKFNKEIQLTPGNNTVEIIARNAQGQVSRKTLTIKYEKVSNVTDTSISSSPYTIDISAATITGVANNTSVSTFKSNITPAPGATIEVYQADKKTIRTDNILSGDVLIVTAADKSTKKAYTITLVTPGAGSPGNVVQLDPQTVADLNEVSRGLGRAINQMSDEPQKSLGRAIKSNIDKKIVNPSFNHTADIDNVRATYRALSDTQKEDFQDAVLYNIPVQCLMRLAEFFGFK